MQPPAQCIREYYSRIDTQDTAWVLSLFAPNAVYERAGVTYSGAEEMRQFFCVQRQIRGTHTIHELWSAEADVVIVLGRFDGVGATGDHRRIRFADVWWFDGTGHVSRRETFLATGHAYVES